MKQCNSCSKGYGDEFDFCPECGKPLVSKKKFSNQKKLIFCLIGLVIIVVSAITIHEHLQFKNQQEAIAISQHKKAVKDYKTTPTVSDIEIVPGWKDYVKGNYIYIEGSVRNSSQKKIRYYEIGIKFLDAQGNVIDSTYTNGIDLDPGELQEFDSMHKNNLRYSKVELYVKKVS